MARKRKAVAEIGLPPKKKSAQSQAEEDFLAAFEARPIPGHDMQREYRFHPTRRWRLDFAFPSVRVGVEIQGMGMGGRAGGHQTAFGIQNDCDKNNAAILLGWQILKFRAGDRRHVDQWVDMVHEVICG